MNTNTTILNLEITGQTSHNGATLHQCIFMCAGRSHNIILATNTIDYEGMIEAMLEDSKREDFSEFMNDDCTIEVAEQDDIKAITAVVSNSDYLYAELAKLNTKELEFAKFHTICNILDSRMSK